MLALLALMAGAAALLFKLKASASGELATIRRDLGHAAQEEHDLSGEIERMRETEAEALIALGIGQASPELL